MEKGHDGKATPAQAELLEMAVNGDLAKTVRADVEEKMGTRMVALAAQVAIYYGSLKAQGMEDFEAMELSKAFQQQMMRTGG